MSVPKFSLAHKRLTSVEVDPSSSNQHEFQGIQAFRNVLGDERTTLDEIPMVMLSDEHEPDEVITNSFTWYDARENNPDRSSEFRLVYKITPAASPGDLLTLIRDDRHAQPSFAVLIADEGSTWESQLLQISGIDNVGPNGSTAGTEPLLLESVIQSKFLEPVLAILGWDEPVYENRWRVDDVIKQFPDIGDKLPSGAEISSYVYQCLSSELDIDDADSSIIKLYEAEEALFLLLEENLYGEKVRQGFDDFKDFITLAKSMTQSRRSRAGKALENHLEIVLLDRGVDFSREERTENKNKPDFIFPSIEEYRDKSFPSSNLKMLGVKTTAKDRWRQILPEANRIPRKHLMTLEPNISESQRQQMETENVQLVVPRSIDQYSFTDIPVHISVNEFIRSLN